MFLSVLEEDADHVGIFAGIGGEIKRPLSGRLSGHEPAYFSPRLSSRILGVTKISSSLLLLVLTSCLNKKPI